MLAYMAPQTKPRVPTPVHAWAVAEGVALPTPGNQQPLLAQQAERVFLGLLRTKTVAVRDDLEIRIALQGP